MATGTSGCASTSTLMPHVRTSRRWWHSRRSVRRSSTLSPTRLTSSSKSADQERMSSLQASTTTFVPAVIVGAGHAGLAMSHRLAQRSIDHLVLERGELANSWRTERWESLRLLTPNWQSRLPGYGYAGSDPDAFRTMPETIEFIEQYAKIMSAPVRTHTSVTSVRRSGDGYEVATNQGTWQCEAVVIATGACNIARVPAVASAVPAG